tara:strand:+ start:119 stop:532 length:414 start_codon:yes stop_codon:yes gene_type:complete
MSADFLFVKTPKFTMTEDRKNILTEELSNMTPQNYDDLRDELFWNDESVKAIQEGCLEIIEEAMDLGWPSDATYDHEYNKNGERMEILYTGGMSWGDSPTDSYDLVSSIGHIPLWDTIERFAVEDCKVTTEDCKVTA